MIYFFLPSASCAIFAGETVAKNSLACYYKQRHTEIVQRQKTFLTGMKKRRAPPPPCKKSLLNFPPPLLCRRHRGCNEKFPFLRVLQYVPAFLARDKSRRAILLPGKAASVIPPFSSPFKDQTEKEERDDLTAHTTQPRTNRPSDQESDSPFLILILLPPSFLLSKTSLLPPLRPQSLTLYMAQKFTK